MKAIANCFISKAQGRQASRTSTLDSWESIKMLTWLKSRVHFLHILWLISFSLISHQLWWALIGTAPWTLCKRPVAQGEQSKGVKGGPVCGFLNSFVSENRTQPCVSQSIPWPATRFNKYPGIIISIIVITHCDKKCKNSTLYMKVI